MNSDGKMPSLKNRCASIVMIEVKASLHSFRRVVESGLSVTSCNRKIHQNYDKLKKCQIDTVYSCRSLLNDACCCCLAILNSYSQRVNAYDIYMAGSLGGNY